MKELPNKQTMPKYHETFMAILDILSSQSIMSSKETVSKVISKHYSNLPKDLLRERVKTGGLRIADRVNWGIVYLKMAKMIVGVKRGEIQITAKGLAALKQEKPVTLTTLKTDKDYIDHKNKVSANKGSRPAQTEIIALDDSIDPEELVEETIDKIEKQVKSDLLERLKQTDPYDFEKVVLCLFKEMNYGEFEETPKSNDGGIDGVINRDDLGIEKIYIQSKRYSNHNVRELEIRNFIGAMSGGTNKGIFVTTSSFDNKAIEKAKNADQTIILMAGEQLVDLMYKYNVGIETKGTYETKKINEDFFDFDDSA